jgi:trigger factor
MTVEIVNETITTKEVRIIVPESDFNEKYDEKLKKLSKTVKLEGFRKGKVPVALIKKRFGKSLKAEITEDLLQETSTSYLKDLEVLMISQPAMKDFNQEKTGGFNYTIEYEFIPDFDMGQYKGLNIEIEAEKLNEEDFDKYLKEQFLPGFSKKVAVEGRDIIENTDLAVIDIKAYKDGQDVEEFNKVDFPLEVGKDIFTGIDAAVLGKKIGDEIEFNYVKDENSDPILFKISVKKLERFEIPELNEDFVQQYFAHGREEYNVEVFLNDLKSEYQLQIDKKNNGKLVEGYINLITTRYDLEIPKTILEGAKQDFLGRHLQMNKDAKVDDKEKFFEENKEDIEKLAKQQVYILKLKDVEHIHSHENEIINYINTFSRQYGIPQEEAIKLFSDKNRYSEIVALIENQKIEEFIVNNNNLVDLSTNSDSSVENTEE